MQLIAALLLSLLYKQKEQKDLDPYFLKICVYRQMPTPCSPNSQDALRARRTRPEYLLHLIKTYASFQFISTAIELGRRLFHIKCLISTDLSGLFFVCLCTRLFS